MSMIDIYNEHHVDTPYIKKNYKDALLTLDAKKCISVHPVTRKAGTFADHVKVKFPSRVGAG
jgi:hypothetical protein